MDEEEAESEDEDESDIDQTVQNIKKKSTDLQKKLTPTSKDKNLKPNKDQDDDSDDDSDMSDDDDDDDEESNLQDLMKKAASKSSSEKIQPNKTPSPQAKSSNQAVSKQSSKPLQNKSQDKQ